MHEQTDHEGRPIAADESDDASIRVLEFEPHPCSDYDCCIERSWQRMLELIRGNLDCMLERHELDELLEEPFVLKIRLREMRKSEYLELISEV